MLNMKADLHLTSFGIVERYTRFLCSVQKLTKYVRRMPRLFRQMMRERVPAPSPISLLAWAVCARENRQATLYNITLTSISLEHPSLTNSCSKFANRRHSSGLYRHEWWIRKPFYPKIFLFAKSVSVPRDGVSEVIDHSHDAAYLFYLDWVRHLD